jgi:hypothetical protein
VKMLAEYLDTAIRFEQMPLPKKTDAQGGL